MKNFKQVIAPLILAIFVAGTAVLVNAAWSDPTCGATGCNKESVISTSIEDQVKSAKFISSGFVDNSITYDGLVASMYNIESAGHVTVGTTGSVITNEPPHVADFRVVTGSSWFRNPVSIGDQTVTETTTPSVTYDLQLKGTTNIGKGDYCTLRANQLEDPVTGACPSTGTFGPSFMNWYRVDARAVGPNVVAAHCGKLVPTSNSSAQNLGACYPTPQPTLLSINVVHTGANNTCQSTDTYNLSAAFSHDDATPLVYKWQIREVYANNTTGSWVDISNSNSLSIGVTVQRYGYNQQFTTQKRWQYRIVMTDSLNQTVEGITSTINEILHPYPPTC